MLATLAIINMAVASVLITDEVSAMNAQAAQEPTPVVATVEQTDSAVLKEAE